MILDQNDGLIYLEPQVRGIEMGQARPVKLTRHVECVACFQKRIVRQHLAIVTHEVTLAPRRQRHEQEQEGCENADRDGP